jgi:hypothetical protein
VKHQSFVLVGLQNCVLTHYVFMCGNVSPRSESILSVLDEESATGDEPSKMLIVPAWQWPGAPHLGKIGREIIPDSERRGQIIDMFLKARDLCAVVKRAEGVWSVFGSWIVIGLAL